MLTTKFNLYNTEWTDRVFDDRNKAYGAYELRHSYSNTMVKAMAITFISVGALFGSTLVFKTNQSVQALPKPDTTVVNIDPNIKPLEEIRNPKPTDPIARPKSDQVTIATPSVPVVRPDAETPKSAPDPAPPGTTGPVAVQGAIPGLPEAGPVSTAPPVAPVAEIIYSPGSIDFMPEPVGGAAAWNKFLSKNLRFPVVAQEEGVGGRVYLSFIIEKDGTLSHITVDKAAGHGFDEEALRVLKLAKAWTPGRQNGQPVRVKYSIPITFQAPGL